MKHEYEKSDSVNIRKTSASAKKEVNLKDNQALFFQIGLIVVMLFVLFALEFKTSIPNPEAPQVMDVALSDFTDAPPVVRVEREKPEPIKKTPVSKTLPPKVIPDEKDVIDPDEIFKPTTTDISESLSADDLSPEPEPEEIEEYNLETVERVPIYPGCEGLSTNAERKACLQEHLKTLITRNFDTDAVQSYAKNGLNRISVQFTVDQNGKVTDIKTRAANSQLEREAQRVLSKVPQMQAGSKAGKKVKVIYAQPILFKVEN